MKVLPNNEQKNIKALEKYSLSDADIRKAFKGKKINIVEYQNLDKYNNIDELFANSDFNFCVMFFPENEAESSGHWTCIIKHTNGQYEYFDSYKNYGPDKELKWLSKKLKDELHLNRPLLTNLLNASGVNNVIVNHYPFQSLKPGMNDCGREVITRLFNSNLTLDEYWKKIKQSGLSPDAYVTNFTYNILGK